MLLHNMKYKIYEYKTESTEIWELCKQVAIKRVKF